MGREAFKCIVEEVLSPLDIRADGSRPWDIRILDERFYQRVINGGSLGLGESYMEGWWECERLDEFFGRLLPSDPERRLKKSLSLLFPVLHARVRNLGSKARAFQVGERHYDLGNELYESMLDSRMVYSCGYWKGAHTLEEAQEAKLDLICRKLGLREGERVLDIGCGWGSLGRYAAERYGVEVVGVTVSQRQKEWAEESCRGLPVEVRLEDYRDIRGEYDHVVSVGMFEHVGHKNYRTYMEVVQRSLKEGGLFLLHTIGGNSSRVSTDAWTGKYIFPNSHIPSIKQIGGSVEKLFVVEDWHNIGQYYEPTLRAWFENFDRNWEGLKGGYDERFYRMWKYYLLSCAGAFRARDLQVWQIVLSKKGVPGGYLPLR
ncbi:MAG: cyclopropane fatty acyl phospholipid synthase [Alphaproteobacteria bacterium]|uniref:Cyclopropane fatty acyl phospholipid synthase n=2 Tax=Candidatus Nitrobium versatile TaxID=2884831 RepID=A0A953SER9_9BACT|nr:cyclopropane fatty acyl phospholipid synthase [Candidatus Nitrobium versatile]